VMVEVGFTVVDPMRVEVLKEPGVMATELAFVTLKERVEVPAEATIDEEAVKLLIVGAVPDAFAFTEPHAEPFHSFTKTCRNEPEATSPQLATGWLFRTVREIRSALPFTGSAFSDDPKVVHEEPFHLSTYVCAFCPMFCCSTHPRYRLVPSVVSDGLNAHPVLVLLFKLPEPTSDHEEPFQVLTYSWLLPDWLLSFHAT
jgi:hypothetical protein